MADIVGFGDAGVQTALATGDGGFGSGKLLAGFSYDQAWRVDKHVVSFATLTMTTWPTSWALAIRRSDGAGYRGWRLRIWQASRRLQL